MTGQIIGGARELNLSELYTMTNTYGGSHDYCNGGFAN